MMVSSVFGENGLGLYGERIDSEALADSDRCGLCHRRESLLIETAGDIAGGMFMLVGVRFERGTV
jgi:hypothetical protein